MDLDNPVNPNAAANQPVNPPVNQPTPTAQPTNANISPPVQPVYPQATTPSVPPVQGPSTLKLMGIIVACVVGGFLVLGGLAFTAVMMATSGPVKVADEQFNDLKQGNTQAAYNLFSSPAKAQTTFEQFQTSVQRLGMQNDPTTSLSIAGRHIVNNSAELTGTVKINGITRNVIYTLENTGGTWLIDGMDMKAAQ